MSDQTESRPDPQERVTVRYEGDESTEREVRRCTLKHMAEGWEVVGEKTPAAAESDGNGDAGGSGDNTDKPKGRRGGTGSQEG